MYITQLNYKMQRCTRCYLCILDVNKDDGDLKGKVVGYGLGSIFFIAEHPNCNRHGTRYAFDANDYGSNKIFSEVLKSVGLSRSKVFVTNLVKCSTENNEQLKERPILACKYWLDKELDIIKPKVIVALGETVAKLFERKQLYNGYKVMYTCHPAYIARRQDKKEEYIKIFKKIKMEIFNEVL